MSKKGGILFFSSLLIFNPSSLLFSFLTLLLNHFVSLRGTSLAGQEQNPEEDEAGPAGDMSRVQSTTAETTAEDRAETAKQSHEEEPIEAGRVVQEMMYLDLLFSSRF